MLDYKMYYNIEIFVNKLVSPTDLLYVKNVELV